MLTLMQFGMTTTRGNLAKFTSFLNAWTTQTRKKDYGFNFSPILHTLYTRISKVIKFN